jgi:hypothetical protein
MHFIYLILLAFTLTACLEDDPSSHQRLSVDRAAGAGGHYAQMESVSSFAPPALPAPRMAAKSQDYVGTPSDMALDRSQFEGRKIAENHTLQIETPRESLQARYQRDLKQCISLGCEIVNSSVNSAGYANIHARISPEALPKFLDSLAQGVGEITSHQLGTDDRTHQYMDTQAKLRNQQALRDRLRSLMADRKFAKIHDLLQVERELARVQSQIDSLTGQLRHVAQITERATVQVNYKVPPEAVKLVYHNVSDSFRHAWNGLLKNVSAVISFVAKSLPWLPVIFIGFWLFGIMFRIAFRRTGSLWKKLAFWRKDKNENL